MTILDQIKRLRELRGWSSDDLSLLTGLEAERITDIEEGSAIPSLDELERIASALGMRVWLVPREAGI